MHLARVRALCCILLPAAALSGCGMDQHYYVKTDGSADVLHGVIRAAPATPGPQRIDLGVTFKSSGEVSTYASDELYDSVSKGLRAKGKWELHRIGRAGDDFAPEIAAVMRAQAAAAVPAPAVSPQAPQQPPAQLPTQSHPQSPPRAHPQAPVQHPPPSSPPLQAAAQAPPPPQALPSPPPQPQRMLVLVENSPDLSTGTQMGYVVSGMTFGARSMSKPTDRYDVTIAYRDSTGADHVYHSHQDMLFVTRNKYLETGGDSAVAGLKPYDNTDDAFDALVGNSVNGTQKGVVAVGRPQLNQSTPPKAPVQAAPAKPAAKP